MHPWDSSGDDCKEGYVEGLVAVVVEELQLYGADVREYGTDVLILCGSLGDCQRLASLGCVLGERVVAERAMLAEGPDEDRIDPRRSI